MGAYGAIAAAIIAAAGSAATIHANNKNAEAQMQAAANEASVNRSLDAMEQEEINRQTGFELTENQRQFMRERAKLRTAQAESGLVGASPLRDIANTYMQEAMNASTIIDQGESRLSSSQLRGEATNVQSQNKYTTAKSKSTTGWQAGLQIASSSTSAYGASGGFSK